MSRTDAYRLNPDMNRFYRAALAALIIAAAGGLNSESLASDFLRVEGKDIVDSHGNKFFIKGTNTGNWLNPEGYMFGFRKVNSPHMIDEAFRQLVGPTATKAFWQKFKDNYITEADFAFIAECGANTVRIPFHYKLFTAEDYMGLNDPEEGFRRIDDCVGWARSHGLRLILDMHDCPGGQTGDNIDDSYGYPWLMIDDEAQREFVDIWRRIAERYADEDVIIGYELANEPIATYWEGEEREMLNSRLEPLYKHATAAIREVDRNHIVLLGGPQWNSEFGNFSDWTFDDNIMYTCHRYGGDPTPEAIGSYIEFRDRTGRPMYMGELGHNTMEWQSRFADTLMDANIGYTFWPYKKIADSAMTGVEAPEGWHAELVEFVEAPRGSYAEIREARRHCTPERGQALLDAYIENARAEKMLRHDDYIRSIKLK